MRALSIRQPWAWLIVAGHKDVENRTWPTRFRGAVLIHAGQRPDPRLAEIRARVLAEFHIEIPEHLDLGGIVGQAEITDCVQRCPSAWFEGPYGFVLRNAKALAFRPLKGKLSFFTVPD